MKKLIEILNSRGSAMMNVIVASTVVGVGAVMLSQTGDQRGLMTLDMNQNSLIENTVFDIRVKLTDRAVCDASMATGFTEIAEFRSGFEVGHNVTIREIREVTPHSHEVIPERVKKIMIAFTKEQKAKNLTRDRGEFVYIQEFDEDGDGTMDFCTSVETLGINNAFSQFCSAIAGPTRFDPLLGETVGFDPATGRCNTNSLGNPIFNQTLNRIACEGLGGQFNASTQKCDRINIPGNVFSSHLNNTAVSFPDNLQRRTGFVDDACTGTNLGIGVNEDGTLDCRDPVCRNPLDGGSTYSLQLLAGDVYCTCNKNRAIRNDGRRVQCGSVDPNSCSSYSVDDQCNMGTQCTIRAGKSPDCSCAASTYVGDWCPDPNGCVARCWGTRPLPPPPPPAPPPGPPAGSAQCGATINTCISGTPSGLSTTGDTSTWVCTDGSDTANCSFTAGATCGPADGGEFATAPSSGLCSSGGAAVTETPTGYNWSCGTNSCSATKPPAPPECPPESSIAENLSFGRSRCTQITYSAAPECTPSTRTVTANQCQQIMNCVNGQMASVQSNGLCTWQVVSAEDDCVRTHPACSRFVGNACDGSPGFMTCETREESGNACQINTGIRCQP